MLSISVMQERAGAPSICALCRRRTAPCRSRILCRSCRARRATPTGAARVAVDIDVVCLAVDFDDEGHGIVSFPRVLIERDCAGLHPTQRAHRAWTRRPTKRSAAAL
jgi:hypothetical protein